MGESRSGTIGRLDPNALGYQDVDDPEPVTLRVDNPRSNTGYRYYVIDMSGEVGAGNAGAVGIDRHCNNYGSITNVTVKSLDPQHAVPCKNGAIPISSKAVKQCFCRVYPPACRTLSRCREH